MRDLEKISIYCTLIGKIRTEITQYFVGVLITLYMTGCATGPTEEQGFLFYPPMPNPPRIQHLVTFSNENDLKGGGSFAAFVLGGAINDSSVGKPYGLATDDGKIYVVDSDNAGYAIFDLKNKEYHFIMGSGGGTLQKPINIEIDKDGTKYITDTERQQVVVFDKEDNYIRAYGVEGQFKPSDVALDENRIYIADLLNSKIIALDKKTGEVLFDFPPKDKSSPAHLAHPTNIALNGSYLYVADSTQARVNKYTTSGKYLSTLGDMGTGLGQFARPKGIAIDKTGNIYVVDAAFDNVQIFSKEGKLLLYFGQSGYERRNINLPTTVVLDYNDTEYFKQFAAPGFHIEYVILVASQFGMGKVNAFGFGKMEGMEYSLSESE